MDVCHLSRRPLHIVPARRKSVQQERVSRTDTRIVCGVFTADLIMDRHTEPPIWHCIVQRAGSPDIIYWGQELTFAAAESAAEEHLRELTARERQKKARAGR
jgi:hypothetical protein